jgi:hypothetical protein
MLNFSSNSVPARPLFKSFLSAGLLLGCFFLVLAPAARSQITINFVYDGTDTTLTYSVAPGSLSSLTYGGTTSTSDEHHVGYGGLANVTSSTLDYYNNPGYTNSAWGPSVVPATSYSGDPIRFWQGSSGVRVPMGFNPATGTLAGTMLWTSTSLMALGFASNATTSGSFAAFGSIPLSIPFATTVNWSATNTAIPEPGTYAALLGLAALGVVGAWRRVSRT